MFAIYIIYFFMYCKQILTALLAGSLMFFSCSDSKRDALGKTEVVIETSRGNIVVRLFDDTPLHRDNFVRMINDGVYNGVLWNRVVPGGTIQSGEPTHTPKGTPPTVDTTDYRHTVPCEIRYPRYFHKAGVLAMARQPDDVNPKRESSGTHFYIVTGRHFTRTKLAELWHYRQLTEPAFSLPSMPEEHKKVYTSRGGAPHLDGDYTIFGQVVDGMHVVESIGKVPIDEQERPLKEVVINKVWVRK